MSSFARAKPSRTPKRRGQLASSCTIQSVSVRPAPRRVAERRRGRSGWLATRRSTPALPRPASRPHGQRPCSGRAPRPPPPGAARQAPWDARDSRPRTEARHASFRLGHVQFRLGSGTHPLAAGEARARASRSSTLARRPRRASPADHQRARKRVERSTRSRWSQGFSLGSEVARLFMARRPQSPGYHAWRSC